MAGNIIEQILSLKSRQGGFTYEGSDKQEEIPAKWNISGSRKVASQQKNSQGASLRGEAESASLDSSIESKELLERKVCLKCQEEHQEMIYLANYRRPSGDGVCCSILRCIYDCMDIFAEAGATNFGEGPLRTLMPECTHPLVEDGVIPVITLQPEVSANTAQVPSNEDKVLTLKDEELPVLQEEDIVSTDHQHRSDPAHSPVIMFHREKLLTPTHSSSPKSQYASAVDLLEFKEADERGMPESCFAPETGESIELQEIDKAR